jgi:hypothetical protein
LIHFFGTFEDVQVEVRVGGGGSRILFFLALWAMCGV